MRCLERNRAGGIKIFMLSKFKKQFYGKGEIYLRIKVRAGAAKTDVREILEDETIKIDIAAPPIKGKANQELVKFLAREFEISGKNVKIISGAGDRVKLIRVIYG